jgi:rubrerythrin
MKSFGRSGNMEKLDAEKERQVWGRVRGDAYTAPDLKRLPALIASEEEAADTYLQLSRKLQGKERMILQRMSQEEQAHAACLKGIYHLMTGERASTAYAPKQNTTVEVTLRRCYGKEMRCLAEYEARAQDKEYGAVFLRLAQQEQEHCRMLLEILGNLK